MIGRSLFCAAALVALVSPVSTAAQVVHNYAPVATVTLPEVGDPKAVVFADVGGMRKTAAGAEMDVIYALGDAQTFDGKETSQVDFQYAVACGPKTLETKGYTPSSPAGPGKFVPLNQPGHAPGDVMDQTLLDFACRTGPAPFGYPTTEQMQAHARAFLRSRAEQDRTRTHNFLFIGSGAGGSLGPFVVFVDAASLERVGDQVTAQIVEIFQPRAKPEPHAMAYAINTTVYDCGAKTQKSLFTALYEADGAPLNNRLTGAAGKPVNPSTIDERAMNLACTDGESAKGSTSVPVIEGAIVVALRTLAANAAASKAAPTANEPPPAAVPPAK